MASIRKLPSGKWNAQVRRHGYSPVSKSFLVEKDAIRWARNVESELDRGLLIDISEAKATTLADALKRYLAEVTPHKKGHKQERQRIKAWLKRPVANRSLASLRPKDFAVHRDNRIAEGVSSNTVRLELALLSHLFNAARKEWGVEVQNPIAAIRMPRGSSARSRRLEGDEEARLLRACRSSKSKQIYHLVVLAIETGMRLGELLKLTWADVDLPNRKVILRETKNGQVRGVPLTKLSVSTLQEISLQADGSRVFHSWNGRSDGINSAWRKVVKRAYLLDFRFHDLRHEATSRLFEKGLTAIEVASITGHKTMTMLMRYTHLKLASLIEKID
jgi:integrase